MIEIITLPDAIRRRPAMYLGSLDQQALTRLLFLTIEGILWHYRYLDLSPSQMTIQLETDGSATVTSGARQGATASLAPSTRLLREEVSQLWVEQARSFLPQRGVNACSELCVVNALCAHFHVAAHGPENHWHTLLFEQGVFTHERERAVSPNANDDLWLRLWPDFTLMEAGAFDYSSTLEVMKSLAENAPSLTTTVVDVRPQTT